MGTTLSLTASKDLDGRVRRIVAVNTYDFAGGIERANLLAARRWHARAPGIVRLINRMEIKAILTGVMRGGLRNPRNLPGHYVDELRRVGRRPGYPAVARAVFRNLESLIAARERYARVKAPVMLVYGDCDWSRPSDRQANIALLPGATSVALSETGHFAALERPADIARILLNTWALP